MFEKLFTTILLISVTSSVLILVVYFMSSLLKKLYGAKCKYFIWLILAVRLIIPINFSLQEPPIEVIIPNSPVIQREFEESKPSNGSSINIMPPTEITPPVQDNVIDSAPQLQNISTYSFTEICSGIWLLGFISFILYQFIGYYIFKKQILRWSRLTGDNRISNYSTKLCSEMNIKPITILISEKVTSPLIIGFLKPMLILPNDNYSDIDLELILKHEFIHYKRRDLWYKLLIVLANAVHWFNPIVWLMSADANKNIELYCDNEVMKNCDDTTRKLYSETIMTSIERQKHKTIRLTTYFYGGTKSMKERFKNIYDKTQKRSSITAILVVFMIVISSSIMVGFTRTTLEEKDIKTIDYDNNQIENINIEVKDCNVKVEKSNDNEFHYEYDAEKFTVTTSEIDGELAIKIDGKYNADIQLDDMVIIFIPIREYELITVNNDSAGLSMPSGIDADFSLTNNNSAMSIDVEKGYNRDIDFECNNGTGSLNIAKDATDYTLNIKESKNSAISVDFPKYKPFQSYEYINGNGKSNISLDINSSSFAVRNEDGDKKEKATNFVSESNSNSDLKINIIDAPVLIKNTVSDKISASYNSKDYKIDIDQSTNKWIVDVSVINSNTDKSAVIYLPQKNYKSVIIDIDNGMYSGGIFDATNISAKVNDGAIDFSLDRNFAGDVKIDVYNSIFNLSTLDGYKNSNVKMICDKNSLGAAPDYFNSNYGNGNFTYLNGTGSNLMDISLRGGSVGSLQDSSLVAQKDENVSKSNSNSGNKTIADVLKKYEKYGVTTKPTENNKINIFYKGTSVKRFKDETPNGNIVNVSSDEGGKIYIETVYDNKGNLIDVIKSDEMKSASIMSES